MIHLYCLNISNAEYAPLYAKASPARQTRAKACLRREDALRCVAGEALLRYALGTAAFETAPGRYGKPHVLGREDFHFNLSHSGQWVVLAWGDSPVGVDVEGNRPGRKKDVLTRRFFTPEEQDYVFRQEDGRERRFLEIWTGKESYLKYLGTGLQKPLTSFSVLSLEETLHHWVLDGDYVVTLCCRDREVSMKELSAEQLG